jgi:two-component system sensor histidine kinase BaeS
MTMWNKLRRHLVVKLFLSYLIVILIGMIVEAITVEITIPVAFQRHMSGMQNMMGMMGSPTSVDIFGGFRAGVNEALAVATAASVAVAFAASIFISRRVVAPVQEITQASLRIADGQYNQRVVVANRDSQTMDELAKLGQAFNRMAERLEHTEEMRRQLLGDVSHELRTPLTVIKGSMEALVDGVLPADKQTFQQIEQETDRLQRLVNDLQELSRVEAGAYELDLQPIAPTTLVEKAIQRMERQFRDKGVTISTSLVPDLPIVQGDMDRLMQVLINLLGNACQYTPEGGQVQVQAKRQGREIVIAVTDNGIGISAEHLPHLFTRFYRVEKSRSRQAGGGSGIGLTIARHLVEAHGGRIWAESAGVGTGSTFAFSLPAQKI